ncbi:MAG: VOC family protein [Candidatus Gastranaerophilales bacterium]|nr:VOC family protein [Candidatus Gastranaerophilales bacterium]
MKYLHAMIRVMDLKKSLRFYCDFLGFEIVKEKTLDDCKLYYLGNKESGDAQIELTDNFEKPEKYENGRAFGHFAFATDDMNETEKRMKDFGYEWFYEPYELSAVSSIIAFTKDPDGNEIEFIQKR